MKDTVTAELALIEARCESEAPAGETALGFLQAVYRDQRQPLHTRLRAATEALPYEALAAALDRAIARSNGKAPLLIEGRAEEQVD